MVQQAQVLTKVNFGLLPTGLAFLTIIMAVWFIRTRPASNVKRGRS
jgi:hypothetical protein